MVRASLTAVEFDLLTGFDFEAHLLDIDWLTSWIVKELTLTLLLDEWNHCIAVLNIL